jgi:hypothetical protein
LPLWVNDRPSHDLGLFLERVLGRGGGSHCDHRVYGVRGLFFGGGGVAVTIEERAQILASKWEVPVEKIVAHFQEVEREVVSRYDDRCIEHSEIEFKRGFNAAKEKAAGILTGDVLDDPAEFEGKIKLKVFDLLEKLGERIRTMEP